MVKFRKIKKNGKIFKFKFSLQTTNNCKITKFHKIIKLDNANTKLTAIKSKHKSAENNQSFNFMIICQYFLLFLLIENKNP